MILHSIDQVLLSGIDIPERMNNPLDYQPHPLCIAVCKELQTYLSEREDWREEIDKGKMFGVLIVENAQPESGASEIGYLAAYSGQIGGRSDWDDFVPAVFDYLQPDGYFKTHEAEISDINQRIKQLEGNEHIKEAKSLIQQLQEERKQTIAAYQEKMKEAKAKRDARRKTGNLTPEEEAEMVKESQFMKAELRRLKKSLSEKTTLETEYEVFQADILRLKQLRKTLSDALQQWLFSQFRMQNHEGKMKDLLEIFRDAALRDYPQATLATSRIAALKMVPPAGSGECCEPKLLQYAYLHGYRPLQMAMFWWGESPKEEIRHHLQFYPACNGKCKPILHWMLPDRVFDSKIAEKQALETLYEDDQLTVIYKPSGLLSVPGKDSSQPSVYSIMRKKYPAASSPLIVHRLDMATSGLMIIAKTDFAYHRLQKEFLHHRVQKKYIAIIGCKDQEACDKIWEKAKKEELKEEGKSSISAEKQKISLPLMPDYLDRPRQIVNHDQGKEAITEYEVLDRIDATHLRLALYPKTGRTHQLRVHCAHHEGLNAPILGDPLYGNEKASRLHLHAEEIIFEHPLTGKEINIKREADFIYP
ncbi:RluA family pseudouridine synthase [Segatella copri]|uniref:RluA family pseudouridine synthase n=1 Tax=Segatella copri TaxID=165179 RepID=UPI00193248F0|nr:RluA family pseudouridine synthase [Segatella copri]MBM0145163.1 RluA family pseudouridine synthase [Segatella copri]